MAEVAWVVLETGWESDTPLAAFEDKADAHEVAAALPDTNVVPVRFYRSGDRSLRRARIYRATVVIFPVGTLPDPVVEPMPGDLVDSTGVVQPRRLGRPFEVEVDRCDFGEFTGRSVRATAASEGEAVAACQARALELVAEVCGEYRAVLDAVERRRADAEPLL